MWTSLSRAVGASGALHEAQCGAHVLVFPLPDGMRLYAVVAAAPVINRYCRTAPASCAEFRCLFFDVISDRGGHTFLDPGGESKWRLFCLRSGYSPTSIVTSIAASRINTVSLGVPWTLWEPGIIRE